MEVQTQDYDRTTQMDGQWRITGAW